MEDKGRSFVCKICGETCEDIHKGRYPNICEFCEDRHADEEYSSDDF